MADSPMAQLMTQSILREMVREGTIISGGSEECAEGVKYDFRLGPHFLKAKYGVPVDYNNLTSTERASATIEPGEVVFVLSEEIINLPADMIIVLSQKRKISHDGISVLGGLCVDPGYKGPLLVGLYNFSSQPFRLQPGKKLIAGLLYRLDDQEKGPFPAPTRIDGFPDDLVKLISAYQPVNIVALGEQISGLRNEVISLKQEIADDKQWRKDFRSDLDDLLKALSDEKSVREKEYDVVKAKIDEASKKVGDIERSAAVTGVSVAYKDKILWFVVGILVSGVLALIVSFLRK